MDYVSPKFRNSAFNCPNCGAYSRQEWRYPIRAVNQRDNVIDNISKLSMAFCENCRDAGKALYYSIWLNDRMIFPRESIAPLPPLNMPEDVLEDYNEARNVLEDSPRSSAALLRLAIQKLCRALDEKGNNINDDIASLVSKGLPLRVQKALDVVRVVGNHAVHPGTIDLNDNPSIALSLFKLVNIIVDDMITQPKEINELFDSLPEKEKKNIKKRDRK